MMDLCETCNKKISCNQCGKQLCYCDPNRDEYDRKPHNIEGHYHIYGEVLCIECHEKKHRDNLL